MHTLYFDSMVYPFYSLGAVLHILVACVYLVGTWWDGLSVALTSHSTGTHVHPLCLCCPTLRRCRVATYCRAATCYLLLLPTAVTFFRYLLLSLPTTIATYCCCLLSLPTVAPYCRYLLLLPTVATYFQYLLMSLPIAATYCCCLLSLPTVATYCRYLLLIPTVATYCCYLPTVATYFATYYCRYLL